MKPVHVTSANFKAEVLESPVPVLVDFWAPWCGPCRAVGPLLDQLAAEHDGKVKIAKVNVDEEPALAQAFQVRGIPTLVTLRGGEVADVTVGFPGPKAVTSHVEGLAASA